MHVSFESLDTVYFYIPPWRCGWEERTLVPADHRRQSRRYRCGLAPPLHRQLAGMGEDKASRADPEKAGREAATLFLEHHQSAGRWSLGQTPVLLSYFQDLSRIHGNGKGQREVSGVSNFCGQRLVWIADTCHATKSRRVAHRIWTRNSNREVQDLGEMPQLKQSKSGAANAVRLWDERDQRATSHRIISRRLESSTGHATSSWNLFSGIRVATVAKSRIWKFAWQMSLAAKAWERRACWFGLADPIQAAGMICTEIHWKPEHLSFGKPACCRLPELEKGLCGLLGRRMCSMFAPSTSYMSMGTVCLVYTVCLLNSVDISSVGAHSEWCLKFGAWNVRRCQAETLAVSNVQLSACSRTNLRVKHVGTCFLEKSLNCLRWR